MITQKDIDAVLITDLKNVRYLTGFSGSFGWCLISNRNENRYFITDGRYKEIAEKTIKGFIIEIVKKQGVIKTLKSIIERENIKLLQLELKVIRYFEYDELKRALNIKLIPLESYVNDLRAIKNSEELKKIKMAIRIARKSFKEILPLIKPGVKERDIAIEYEYRARKNGAEEVPFSTIVAFGENSSMPHYKTWVHNPWVRNPWVRNPWVRNPSSRELRQDEPVLMDFGATFDGYSCDLTRMLIYGKIGRKFLRIYNIVKDTIKYMSDKIRPGMEACEADRLARNYLKGFGLSKYFTHSLGHGIGLDIHERPELAFKSKERLKRGMVFTIEPGVYLPGKFGIRIENNYLLKNSPILLSGPGDEVIFL